MNRAGFLASTILAPLAALLGKRPDASEITIDTSALRGWDSDVDVAAGKVQIRFGPDDEWHEIPALEIGETCQVVAVKRADGSVGVLR